MEQHHTHPLTNILLWISAWIFNFASGITFDNFYNYTFKSLSLISLIIILIINWKKMMDIFKKKQNGKDPQK